MQTEGEAEERHNINSQKSQKTHRVEKMIHGDVTRSLAFWEIDSFISFRRKSLIPQGEASQNAELFFRQSKDETKTQNKTKKLGSKEKPEIRQRQTSCNRREKNAAQINIHRSTRTSEKDGGKSLLIFSSRWCSPGDLAAKGGKKEKQKSEQRVQRLRVRWVMDEAAMRTEGGKATQQKRGGKKDALDGKRWEEKTDRWRGRKRSSPVHRFCRTPLVWAKERMSQKTKQKKT